MIKWENRGLQLLEKSLSPIAHELNESVRKRFAIAEKNYPMASRIIADTIESGLIKLTDPKSGSKRHATYLPFWA